MCSNYTRISIYECGWITYEKTIVKPAPDGCGMEWEAELPANGIFCFNASTTEGIGNK
jgi:hypothetical protein